MAFGSIYSETWWGDGLCTNPIDWGKIYEGIACNFGPADNLIGELGDNLIDEQGDNLISN